MIARCPYCGNEYEIELDHSVGEITIRCPKCKVPFVINKQKEQRFKTIRIVANESLKSAKNTNSKQKWGHKLLKWTLWIVAICLGVPLCIIVFIFIFIGIRDAISGEGNDPYPKIENVKSEPTYQYEEKHESKSTRRYEDIKQAVYKAGYNTGYTAGNAFDSQSIDFFYLGGLYRSDEKEEWCRSYWGVFCSASGTNIDDESMYQEFKRGFLAGIQKRKNLKNR